MIRARLLSLLDAVSWIVPLSFLEGCEMRYFMVGSFHEFNLFIVIFQGSDDLVRFGFFTEFTFPDLRQQSKADITFFILLVVPHQLDQAVKIILIDLCSLVFPENEGADLGKLFRRKPADLVRKIRFTNHSGCDRFTVQQIFLVLLLHEKSLQGMAHGMPEIQNLTYPLFSRILGNNGIFNVDGCLDKIIKRIEVSKIGILHLVPVIPIGDQSMLDDLCKARQYLALIERVQKSAADENPRRVIKNPDLIFEMVQVDAD